MGVLGGSSKVRTNTKTVRLASHPLRHAYKVIPWCRAGQGDHEYEQNKVGPDTFFPLAHIARNKAMSTTLHNHVCSANVFSMANIEIVCW